MDGNEKHRAFFYQVAGRIGASEAAAFSVASEDKSLGTLCHVRGGDPDVKPERLSAAINSFKEMVRQCVEGDKDGSFEVGKADGLRGPMFCLVTLARRGDRVVGAAAFIIRSADRDSAKLVLRLARWEAAAFLNGE